MISASFYLMLTSNPCDKPLHSTTPAPAPPACSTQMNHLMLLRRTVHKNEVVESGTKKIKVMNPLSDIWLWVLSAPRVFSKSRSLASNGTADTFFFKSTNQRQITAENEAWPIFTLQQNPTGMTGTGASCTLLADILTPHRMWDSNKYNIHQISLSLCYKYQHVINKLSRLPLKLILAPWLLPSPCGGQLWGHLWSACRRLRLVEVILSDLP